MVAVERSKIFVGLGGWEFGEFNKLFYPPRGKKGFHRLEHYSRLFDNVEINATFYNAALTADHARRWLSDVAANKNFVFTVKLFRGFTHSFNATNDDVRSVRSLLEPLAEAEKLGGLVMQFPHSFINTPEHRKYLQQFSRVFYPYRMFVEVRHASWNNRAAFTFLQENGLHLVNVDLPPARECIPFTAEAWDGAAYFRMMGRGKPVPGYSEFDSRSNYFYTKKDLDILYSRIKNVQPAAGVTFVAFHNVVDSALVNAIQLQHRIDTVKHVSAPGDVVHGADVLDRFTELMDARYPLFAKAS
jgi:uncharacterized protein YecE (DUF72 family)